MQLSDIKDPAIMQWLVDGSEHCGWGRGTFKSYINAGLFLEEYMRVIEKTAVTFTKADFKGLARWSVEKKFLARTTIKSILNRIKILYRYLVGKGLVAEDDAPTITRYSLKGAPLPNLQCILPPASLFHLRTSGHHVSLIQATLLEVLLSTAMRRSELIQLRACDIQWGKVPFDSETKVPSTVVGATAELNPSQMVIKRKKPRIIYFSKLACRLLREYMHKYQIPEDSRVPLFPCSPRGVGNHIYRAVKGVRLLKPLAPVQTETEIAEVEKNVGFLDLNPSDVANSILKKRIERAQKKEKKAREAFGMRLNISDDHRGAVRLDRGNFTPHCARYTAVCYYWHRTFDGVRHNSEHLRQLIGHSTIQMLMHYLLKYTLVDSDSVWRTIWVGKPHHWSWLFKSQLNTPKRGRIKQEPIDVTIREY